MRRADSRYSRSMAGRRWRRRTAFSTGWMRLVFDLQDIGTRTWTYVGAMVYSMRAAARLHKPFIVLDRPNPLTGYAVDGPVLDSSLANPNDPAPGRPGLAYAIWPLPLRHAMTIGELALYFNDVMKIHADLHVVPRWAGGATSGST